jgi:hypothetical protein
MEGRGQTNAYRVSSNEAMSNAAWSQIAFPKGKRRECQLTEATWADFPCFWSFCS